MLGAAAPPSRRCEAATERMRINTTNTMQTTHMSLVETTYHRHGSILIQQDTIKHATPDFEYETPPTEIKTLPQSRTTKLSTESPINAKVQKVRTFLLDHVERRVHVKVPLESLGVGADLIVFVVDRGAADEGAQVERLIVLADDRRAREQMLQRTRHFLLFAAG